jgi:hypothetical protein
MRRLLSRDCAVAVALTAALTTVLAATAIAGAPQGQPHTFTNRVFASGAGITHEITGPFRRGGGVRGRHPVR